MQDLSHSRFIDLLRARGIEIAVRDGRLQVSAPAGALDDAFRTELARRKPELLEWFAGGEPGSGDGRLRRMARTGKIPQTSAQQGMWIIEQFTPGNVAYNIPEAYQIDGPVEPEILQRAIDALLTRHETLRTFFYEEDGELLQGIDADARTLLEFSDISNISEELRKEALTGRIQEQARRPFELSRAPLVRFHLFRLTPARHIIFFNIHHIISDRRSLNLLQEELTAFYLAQATGVPAALPELAVQYADYAIWSSQSSREKVFAQQIEYWKEKLAGAPPYLELPLNRPYPEHRTAWGATVPVTIPAALRDQIGEIGRQEGATMFMTLLAGYAALLYLYSGQREFCIGSPFTHRNQVETERIIGLFVNMLVFRCAFDEALSFRQLMQQVRRTALEAFEHSDVPFQRLVRAMKPDPRSLRSPLFQVMFGYDSVSGPAEGRLVQIDTRPGTARFDLTLQLTETAEGISGSFEYCTDLFDAPHIAQLSDRFTHLMAQLASDPDRPIAELNLSRCASEVQEPVQEDSPNWSGRMKQLARRFTASTR